MELLDIAAFLLLNKVKEGDMLVISDIVLQLLGYVAEQERAFIKQRQAEGIKFSQNKRKTSWKASY
ncbi:MAG: hypothetical protein NC390_00465 [Fusobacterium sp.]|nr:hypothetical protein [Fusobacterium sp.]MCM1053812.1 hypothetical protein [Ruminococcus sp.]